MIAGYPIEGNLQHTETFPTVMLCSIDSNRVHPVEFVGRKVVSSLLLVLVKNCNLFTCVTTLEIYDIDIIISSNLLLLCPLLLCLLRTAFLLLEFYNHTGYI